MNGIVVVMGITGDLSRKKIVPALYKLISKEKIDNLKIIGMGRKKLTEDEIIKTSKEFINSFDKKYFNKLKNNFTYVRGDFYKKKTFENLKNTIKKQEEKFDSGNRLFYLATLPRHFETIVDSLKEFGMVEEGKKGWRRVVFEKPFGYDLKSAKKLNKVISDVFDEKQVFRIDHYLGKELVQNVSVLRFTNTIMEALWNKNYIDHFQIILSESEGVKGRGEFYDRQGALKDVVQNHMMQILALVAMEPPLKLTGKYIRDEKSKVLKRTRVENVVLGQYKGYKDVGGVSDDSDTETFASLKVFVDNKRWDGVPFYFITGKKMKKKLTTIYIEFKESHFPVFGNSGGFLPNYLKIQIQPNAGFFVQVNAKVPGKNKSSPVSLDFCHPCFFGLNTPKAYENLFLDVFKDDRSSFVRSDEIEDAWRIIDNIEKDKPRPFSYENGSYPKEADEMIEKDEKSWKMEVEKNV